MGDECAVCHEPLNKHVTVFAGLGQLFCCKRCAVQAMMEEYTTEQLAEFAVEGCIEEVRTADIGIE